MTFPSISVFSLFQMRQWLNITNTDICFVCIWWLPVFLVYGYDPLLPCLFMIEGYIILTLPVLHPAAQEMIEYRFRLQKQLFCKMWEVQTLIYCISFFFTFQLKSLIKFLKQISFFFSFSIFVCIACIIYCISIYVCKCGWPQWGFEVPLLLKDDFSKHVAGLLWTTREQQHTVKYQKQHVTQSPTSTHP